MLPAPPIKLFFDGFARAFRHFSRTCRPGGTGDDKLVQLLTGFERSRKPPWLQAASRPGLGRVVGVTVFWRDGTTATDPFETHPPIGKAREFAKLSVQGATLIGNPGG